MSKLLILNSPGSKSKYSIIELKNIEHFEKYSFIIELFLLLSKRIFNNLQNHQLLISFLDLWS